ncbi:hypothetical protein BDN72DRAFT_800724 [Pluteus cervinus]|uniref:Uncharacterized protein n=1 Tax=Pluteus cervinus TaxID=181527 RepID=A0ACD3AK13_9AGAR|nr:hypothetical protein BDN72DRAFT_800724 [Pluteus cervinus]
MDCIGPISADLFYQASAKVAPPAAPTLAQPQCQPQYLPKHLAPLRQGTLPFGQPQPQQMRVSSVSVVSTSTANTDASLRRSTRKRTAVDKSFSPPRSYTRKRTVSAPGTRKNAAKGSRDDADYEKQEAKRVKLTEQKALTVAQGVKKERRDMARTRWLHRHRALLEPLLPPGMELLETIKREIATFPVDVKYIEYEELQAQPSLIKGGTMKDYQLQGLSFLVWMYQNGMNCILGDEMGLGKTLQTLSLFAYIQENVQGPHDPHLIICPLSVLSSWQAETARWLPSMKTMRFHGPENERSRLKLVMKSEQPDIVITTYEGYVAESDWLKKNRWTYCVLDEGHKIKNSESNVSHTIQGLGSLYRLILTGTPVQNNLVELWSLLHFLYPRVFTTRTEQMFKDSFDLTRGSYVLPFLDAARKWVGTVMLRRTKSIIESDIPPREELTVFLPMSEAQRFWTYRLLTRMDALDLEQIFATTKKESAAADLPIDQGRKEVLSHITNQMRQEQATTGSQTQWKRLMGLLIQLRMVCDHPYCIANAEPDPYSIGEHVVAASSKLVAIDKLLNDILPKGERVLIFSQWTRMLDVLEDFLFLRGIPYARLDGSTRRPRRNLDIRLFQQEKSPYKVFLISTKAGGLGINLTKASTVIMCDSDWNPQNDLQAIARAHRIGQTKPVKVYRLICRGSVEDQMLDRIRRKLFLSMKIMGSDNPSGANNATLGSNELLDILRKGSSALTETGQSMDLARFLSADIQEILEESRSSESVRDAKLEQEIKKEEAMDEDVCLDQDEMARKIAEEEQKLLSGVAQVRCRLFEGKVVKMGHKDIANEWQDLQKRARVDRMVTIGGMTFLLDPPVSEQSTAVAPSSKRSRPKFESEDWCIHCRDGGDLALCTYCPRVFHAKCRGISAAFVTKSPSLTCSQHACTTCFRNTQEAGGMLFRCRTCPSAFCEDCLPSGELDAVGDSVPEFEALGYRQQDNAYFIRCQECLDFFVQNPSAWEEWQEEFREAEKKLGRNVNVSSNGKPDPGAHVHATAAAEGSAFGIVGEEMKTMMAIAY